MKYAKYLGVIVLLAFSVAADWVFAAEAADVAQTFQFGRMFALRLVLFIAFYLLALTWVARVWKQPFTPAFSIFLLALGAVVLYVAGVPIKPFGARWFHGLTPLMSPLLALTTHSGALFVAVGLRGLFTKLRA